MISIPSLYLYLSKFYQGCPFPIENKGAFFPVTLQLIRENINKKKNSTSSL